mmetsp:Transcript_14431/g.22265  ORF Transcript_14431/g.22265 Transcript_14431/m.22265 type:complete len:372 (-) Transcript_14431:41-1156(-)
MSALTSFEGLSSFVLKSGGFVAVLSSVAIGMLYLKQDQLLYFPEIGGIPRRAANNPRQYRSPDEYNIRHESVMIEGDDGVQTHAWLLLQSEPKLAPTIVFFHGNAGNIGLRLPNSSQMYKYLSANILMVEYRGFGDSDDVKPSEAGLKRDSEAALRFISQHPQIDSSKLFIFGRSLGGAVGFHLAQYAEQQNIKVAGLIVENTFQSISRMVDVLMPFLSPLKWFVLRIGWDSEKIAPELKMPILYLAGSHDELVPHQHMKDMYMVSKTSSIYPRLHVVKGGRHNETWLQGGKEYWSSFRSFIADAFKVASGENENAASREADDLPSLSLDMGVETEHPSTGGAIPIMPKNFMGIAKEATVRAHHAGSKKQN